MKLTIKQIKKMSLEELIELFSNLRSANLTREEKDAFSDRLSEVSREMTEKENKEIEEVYENGEECQSCDYFEWCLDWSCPRCHRIGECVEVDSICEFYRSTGEELY